MENVINPMKSQIKSTRQSEIMKSILSDDERILDIKTKGKSIGEEVEYL